MTNAQPLTFETPDQGEETARADLYGLLATLFYAPPSQDLLETIGSAATEGDSTLQQAWSHLVAACRAGSAEAWREEYESLFIGVGKPDLILYGSWYLSGFMMEKPLAALRDDLAALGLRRDDGMTESEDHVAALCEVMRYLIASDDVAHTGLGAQKRFFGNHLQPWAITMCETIIAHPDAQFYATVAALAKAFFEVEMQAFDMV